MTKLNLCSFVFLVAVIACSSQTSDPHPYELDGVRNSVQAGDLVFGGQPTEDALVELKNRGFKTILTTRGLIIENPFRLCGSGIIFVSAKIGHKQCSVTSRT